MQLKLSFGLVFKFRILSKHNDCCCTNVDFSGLSSVFFVFFSQSVSLVSRYSTSLLAAGKTRDKSTDKSLTSG